MEKLRSVHSIFFDDSLGRLIKGGLKSSSFPRPPSFRILTYNIWFGVQDFEARTAELLRIIEAEDADFVGLQEVTPAFCERLLGSKSLLRRYRVSAVDFEAYGNLILSRHPCEFFALDLRSTMGRKAIFCLFEAGDSRVLLANVHLESLANAPVRAEQLTSLSGFLTEAGSFGLFGDFNFSEANEERNVPPGAVDAWLALHGPQGGATWAKGGGWRPDRVFLGGGLVALSAKLVGTESLPKYQGLGGGRPPRGLVTTPSDHFGLVVEVGWRDRESGLLIEE